MAALARFFHEDDFLVGTEIWLDEDTARHIVQVLRHVAGDRVELSNGRGYIAAATIVSAEKKKCKVRLDEVVFYEKPAVALHLGIAFTKNSSRNEWLLEKATELGIQSIIPLSTARTEKERIRHERSRNILMSAMLQSQQYYLPQLHDPTSLDAIMASYVQVEQKFVAHCMDSFDRTPIVQAMNAGKQTLILIGPEGDFTEGEVQKLVDLNVKGVSLGQQRLRTETAAMAACAYFNLINYAEK